MNKLILFDIDNTLFDSPKYIKTFTAAIARELAVEYSEEFQNSAWEAYRELREYSTFDPDLYAPILAKKLTRDLDISRIVSIIMDDGLITSCLYPEVLATFQKLQTLPLTLGIFSSGRSDLQQIKIRQFAHLMAEEHMHIVQVNKKEAVSKIFSQYVASTYPVVFVDDLLPILEEAKKIMPKLVTVWSKRGRHLAEQKKGKFNPDYTVTSMEELLAIVG